tara:strand:+ start:57 stop:464 length:408 start_codon:yes stop_codon:yes gene_type:complete
MKDFENKIINLSALNNSVPDSTAFLKRFRGQQEKEMIQKKRVISCINAFAFIFFIGISTISQFKDTPVQDSYWNEMANDLEYYETELMIFDQYYDSLSVEEFTLFMMEEANLWDAEDLIYFNDLYENTNEYEVSL